MAVSVYDYVLAEASSSTTGGWNTAEGQDPATVNDGMRAHKQNVAGYLDDEGAVNTVAGTGDVITITTGQPFNAYGTGAGQIGTGVQLRFIASAANTTNVTLNVNSIGAKAVRKISGGTDVALSSGDIVAGETYTLIYRATANAAAGGWLMIGAAAVAAATTTSSGIVELATQTEASTLADTTRAITSDGLFFLGGYTTTATAAGTTTLTVTSTYNQYFTGTSTQTVVLPVTSTLVLGRSYRIVNNSTGAVTVQSSGANTIKVMGGTGITLAPGAPGTELIATCILTSGTGTASWDYEYRTPTTDWVAYTPTFTGWGTASVISFYSRRVGDTLEVKGTWTAGTTTGTEARITLGFSGTSANVTSDATKASVLQNAGYAFRNTTGQLSVGVLIEPSVSYMTFSSTNDNGLNAVTKTNGSSFPSSTIHSLRASFPISGW